MEESNRQIFLHGPLGERQLKETLSDLLVGLTISPDQIWLVSPWVTDFDLLDNRSGHWDAIFPAWGLGFVSFSELLVAAMEIGCELNLVTNRDSLNDEFCGKIRSKLGRKDMFKHQLVDRVHTKGLLCSSFFLSGSMNFTYSGANINDERIVLNLDNELIAEARLEFQSQYNPG